MNSRDRRIYEMSVRALAFLKAHQSDFTNIPAVAAAIGVLEAKTPEIAVLGEEKISTTGNSKDATIYKGDLRDDLREAMQTIADMWRPMAKNHENAHNKFRMPRGSDQLLIDTAGSFIEDATPLAAAFTGRGIPADFIADLTAKRDAFTASVVESDTAQNARVGINAGFETPVEDCREAVEDVDPIVKMIYRDDPQKLAEWLSASHVERQSGKLKIKN